MDNDTRTIPETVTAQQTQPVQPVTPMRDVTLDPAMISRATGFDIPMPSEPTPQPVTPTVQQVVPMPVSAPQTQEPEPVPQPVPKPQQPLSMEDIQNRLAQMAPEAPSNTPAESAEPVAAEPEVIFHVPEKKAESFYQTLPDDDKTKVTRARKINIVETKDAEVPTSVRTITSLDEYRRIVKRKITGEYVEVVLANSGYIATVRAATSLEMATILPDDIDDETELPKYAKRFQFAYDHLVTTSVGPMSYNDFLARTSMIDLDALIWAIFKASVPEKQEITIVCGNPNCRNGHPYFYNPSDIVNINALSDETKIQINRIIAARDVEGDAKTVHENAPSVKAKCYKISDLEYVYMKSPDAQMTIERIPLTNYIVEQYGQAVYFTLLMVKSIRKGVFTTDEQTEPTWFDITDPILIAEELINMPDSDMEILLEAASNIFNYDGYTFEIKGPITCPKCGHIDKTIQIDLNRLIFFKVGQLGKRE